MGFFSSLAAIPGKIVGGLTNGFADAAGTNNGFQAQAYGMTPAQTSVNPGALTGQGGDILTHTPAGVDPSVQQAFNYQDPNAAAYTQGAQAGQQQGQAAYGQQQGVNQQFGGLGAMLSQASAGQGPSIAQAQLNTALGQSNMQANSIAASAIANGVNPALAYSQAQNQAAQNNQAAGNNAAIQRVNETLAARQQYGSLLGQQSTANLSQQNLSNQAALNYYGMGQQGSQFGQQSQMSLQQLLSGNYNNAQQINAGVAGGNQSTHNQLAGALISGASQAGAAIGGG